MKPSELLPKLAVTALGLLLLFLFCVTAYLWAAKLGLPSMLAADVFNNKILPIVAVVGYLFVIVSIGTFGAFAMVALLWPIIVYENTWKGVALQILYFAAIAIVVYPWLWYSKVTGDL